MAPSQQAANLSPISIKSHKKLNNKVYCIISDGECNEGTVWESALFASHHQLNNLTVIVDYNKIQSLGRVSEVMELNPLSKKWKSFNWSVDEIDGHSHSKLFKSLSKKSSNVFGGTPFSLPSKNLE